jgi:hypothetical protein
VWVASSVPQRRVLPHWGAVEQCVGLLGEAKAVKSGEKKYLREFAPGLLVSRPGQAQRTAQQRRRRACLDRQRQ